MGMGGGGMPPGGAGMPPGAGLPGSPAGMPPEGMRGLQGQPSPGGEGEALDDVLSKLGFALQRILPRSASAGKALADAYAKVRQAQSELRKTEPLAPPPNFGTPGAAGGGMPGGMGMGML